jgi:hypothetical protein
MAVTTVSVLLVTTVVRSVLSAKIQSPAIEIVYGVGTAARSEKITFVWMPVSAICGVT